MFSSFVRNLLTPIFLSHFFLKTLYNLFWSYSLLHILFPDTTLTHKMILCYFSLFKSHINSNLCGPYMRYVASLWSLVNIPGTTIKNSSLCLIAAIYCSSSSARRGTSCPQSLSMLWLGLAWDLSCCICCYNHCELISSIALLYLEDSFFVVILSLYFLHSFKILLKITPEPLEGYVTEITNSYVRTLWPITLCNLTSCMYLQFLSSAANNTSMIGSRRH